MDFIVTAISTVGAVRLRRDSAAGALKKSIELLAEGYREVEVTDAQGKKYPAIEFARLFADS